MKIISNKNIIIIKILKEYYNNFEKEHNKLTFIIRHYNKYLKRLQEINPNIICISAYTLQNSMQVLYKNDWKGKFNINKIYEQKFI